MIKINYIYLPDTKISHIIWVFNIKIENSHSLLMIMTATLSTYCSISLVLITYIYE